MTNGNEIIDNNLKISEDYIDLLKNKYADGGYDKAYQWIVDGENNDLNRPVKSADYINDVHTTTAELLELLDRMRQG